MVALGEERYCGINHTPADRVGRTGGSDVVPTHGKAPLGPGWAVSPRRRPRHRYHRQRMPQEGQLLLKDTSMRSQQRNNDQKPSQAFNGVHVLFVKPSAPLA